MASCCSIAWRHQLAMFGPFSTQCRAGNVKIRRGSWNEELFRVLEGFPDLAHDDEVDACSGALEMLNPQMKGWGFYELCRAEAEAAAQRSKPQPVQSVPPARLDRVVPDTEESLNHVGSRDEICLHDVDQPEHTAGSPCGRETSGLDLNSPSASEPDRHRHIA